MSSATVVADSPQLSGMQLSSTDDLWGLSLTELSLVSFSSIATGTNTPLDKAAATVSVITQQDIKDMGATDIDQILETIPGFHVGRSDQAYLALYNIRGITSAGNPQTLVLINGIPVTSLFHGNRSQVWGGMPVKSIAKIEVIRGPGSALYGADAFSGVINITTKTASNIDGMVAGARVGSFDTQYAWLEYGNSQGKLETAFTLEYETTAGHKEEIEQGPVNVMKDMLESRLDLKYENQRLRVGYQGRRNMGTGVGIVQSLDPNGRFGSDRVTMDYTYNEPNFTSDWGLETQASFYYGSQFVSQNIWLFPAAVFVQASTDSVIGNPEFKERHSRVSIDGTYTGFNKRIIRLGAGVFSGDIYEVTEEKNFMVTINGIETRPGGLEQVADTAEVYLPEEGRESQYLYLQDEWQIKNNIQLVSGVRYDHYSDFGDTVNPRLALIWANSETLTSKFMYGRAFRAPSISELYAISNPVTLGNPELDPEIIDTVELVLSHQASKQTRYVTNIYQYQITDYIEYSAIGSPVTNTGKRTGMGGELEVTHQFNNELKFLGNYSYQQSKDDETHADIGNAPNHQLYLRGLWQFDPTQKMTLQINRVGEQKRVAGDERSALAAYTTVDFHWRMNNIISSLDVAFTVLNALDENVKEASFGPTLTTAQAMIPGDFPMAGRSMNVEASYEF